MPQTEAHETTRRSRPTTRWRIAHKLTTASVLMVILTLLAGGFGLWQVIVIGQTIDDARDKQQQLVRSMELLAAGDGLVAAMDHMLAEQNSLLASTEVIPAMGILKYHMEALQSAANDPEILEILAEMEVIYNDLHQIVDETNLLARQRRWTEASEALEQQIRPANEQLDLLIQELVRQADRDVEAMAVRTQLAVRQATLLLAGLVVSTTAIAWGWRKFVFRGLGSSIGELRQRVARISSSDLEHKLDVRTGDEIEELGYELNKMADTLDNLIKNLEQRVADRTRNLETAAEVARATTSVLDPDELLRQTVNLVRERFRLYYVGLFLSDDQGRFAVLRAGTGDAGRQMLAQNHRLEIGGDSMIGQCVAQSEPRIASDVSTEAVRFDNPLLPKTRTELALPLRSRGRVLGAMSVQGVQEATFDETDIAALQTLADQVAVAIDNAQLFAQAQTALQEAEATHRRYLRQAWTDFVQMAQKTSYETAPLGPTSLRDSVLPEIQAAIKQRGVTVLSDSNDTEEIDHTALVTPITLGGEIIGVLGIQDEDQTRQWTTDQVALVEAVAERMALALENLRLLYATQHRAAREQMISEVSTRMRETLDIETVLKTAVQEVQQALGLPKVTIRLTTPQDNGSEQNGDAFESDISEGQERTP